MTLEPTQDQVEALALLQHARHRLTRREIEACEKMAARGSLNPREADAETPSELSVFKAVRLQFIPELTSWI